MLQTSSNIKEHTNEVVSILIKATSLLFGVRAENQHEDLYQASYNAICERFSKATIQDVKNSYNYATIEKKAYTTLTRDELIQPIFEYFEKKRKLLAEIELIQKRENDKKESEQKEKVYQEDCKKIYLESLEVGKWLGSEIQAYSLRNNFAHLVLPKAKKEMYRQAQIEHRQRKAKQGEFELVPSDVYIYARMFIEQMIERRIKFIEV
jgi:hypothetical protein